jgi:hypothetical protein
VASSTSARENGQYERIFSTRATLVAFVAVAIAALSLVSCSSDSAPSANRASSSSSEPLTSTNQDAGTASAKPEDLVLDIPVGVAPCRASELEFASGGGNPGELPLLRFFNRSGRPCGLAGYVSVFGQDGAGQWQPVAMTKYPHAAVTAAPWTGVFDPSLVAVMNIRPDDSSCTGTATAVHYTALRLVLPGDAGAIDIAGLAFDTGRCPLLVTPITGDSRDS